MSRTSAVVLFATVTGVMLQGLPRRQLLLEPLEQLRLMFRRLNTLVIRLAPLGVLALTATGVCPPRSGRFSNN